MDQEERDDVFRHLSKCHMWTPATQNNMVRVLRVDAEAITNAVFDPNKRSPSDGYESFIRGLWKDKPHKVVTELLDRLEIAAHEIDRLEVALAKASADTHQ